MLERLEVEVKRDYNKALLDYQWAIENHQNGPISKSIVDLERDINRLLVTQSELNVRAPNAGVINDLYVNEGEYLLEGASLAKLSNRVQPVVMVFLPPNRLEYGKIGNRATVTLPDGTSVVGVVSEPTQMANRIPRSLAGPFEDGKVAVQVTLSLETDISNFVEGLPIRVRFYYFE
nr:HlyD family secretion protein [Echinimonas agarilytica]